MGKVTWFELGIFSVASLLAALLIVAPMAGSLASLYMKVAPAITEAYFYETLVICTWVGLVWGYVVGRLY